MEREQQIEAEERLRRERDIAERERRLQARERELRQRKHRSVRHPRNGPCAFGGPSNPDGSCDIGPLRPRNRNKPKGKFNFNIHFGK